MGAGDSKYCPVYETSDFGDGRIPLAKCFPDQAFTDQSFLVTIFLISLFLVSVFLTRLLLTSFFMIRIPLISFFPDQIYLPPTPEVYTGKCVERLTLVDFFGLNKRLRRERVGPEPLQSYTTIILVDWLTG